MNDKKTPTEHFLPRSTKVLAGIVGAFFLAAGGALLLLPPERHTTEFDAAGAATKRTTTSADTTTPTLVLLAGGIGVWVYALNGLRLIRVSAGSLSAEAPNPAEKATEFFKDKEAKERTVAVASADAPIPEPTEPATDIVATSDGEMAVYQLKDVPAKVIRDVLKSWPEAESLPDDLNSFEFASRKRGRGNHPWTIKFRSRPAITLTYGGQGKTDATIEAA